MSGPLTGSPLDSSYHVEALLGRGSMGNVYLAREIKSGLEVAIKVARHASREARERFRREVDVSAKVTHPNVVEILDYGEARLHDEDGVPYLVMERLQGETLGEHFRRPELYKDPDAHVRYTLGIVRQAAQGLAAAHAVGVVHRDVKPDNLFLCGNDEHPTVKLFDFGLAKLADEPPLSRGMVAGTIEYMAPEQVLTEDADARADVYGLGVVMFRLLTQELPFDEALKTELLAHQLLSPAPPPSWLLEAIPESIERIVLSALRKHPENRYRDMDALIQDIDRALAGRNDEVRGAELRHRPDGYTPVTPLGERALERLRDLQSRPSHPPPSRPDVG